LFISLTEFTFLLLLELLFESNWLAISLDLLIKVALSLVLRFAFSLGILELFIIATRVFISTSAFVLSFSFAFGDLFIKSSIARPFNKASIIATT
jgi:hypothetical protein